MTLIDDRYIHLGLGDGAPLIPVAFRCGPTGRYAITADGITLWSGRNALLAGLEWLDVSGEFVSLADILLANCGVSPGAEREAV